MPIWWLRTRFSRLRAALERKIENRVATAVLRKMSIGGENYESSIIPLRSETSWFQEAQVWKFTLHLIVLGGERSTHECSVLKLDPHPGIGVTCLRPTRPLFDLHQFLPANLLR